MDMNKVKSRINPSWLKSACIVIKDIAQAINDTAVDKGWWEDGDDRNQGEMIALMHSELSEALEGIRAPTDDSIRVIRGYKPSDKIGNEGFNQVEEELADTIIRILDFGHHYKLNIPGAIAEKMIYNEGRSYKHGGKKF